MGAIVSSRHRAQKKIQQRNAREAKAIAIAGRKAADQAKIEQLKALKEWVEGDLNRELAMLRTVRLRGRKMRHKVQRLQRVYLATGADPNEVEPGKQAGTTCLMHAAMGGHLEIVEMLLQFGADHTAKNLMRETALSLAVARDFTPVALRLLAEEDPVRQALLIRSQRQGQKVRRVVQRSPLLQGRLGQLLHPPLRPPCQEAGFQVSQGDCV